MTSAAHKPLRVFCSYSRKDEEHLNELRDSLRGLERQGLIRWWHDREIVPGWEWEEEIDKHLRTTDVVLFLVSRAFMASDYVYEHEISKAVERHELGEARVIPIMVRPADWEWASFGKLQALPKDAKPITSWPDQDEAWLDVVRGIRRAVGELLRERQERVAAKEQYRKAVEEAWADKRLSSEETERLDTLASDLALRTDTAVDIERRVMGDTREAILERQEQAAKEKERQDRLDYLYAQAHQAHKDQEWQAVVETFEQIRAEYPDYPDPAGLLASAREALETKELEQRVATLCDRGQRHMKVGEWQQALESFEEVGNAIEKFSLKHQEQAAKEQLNRLYSRARELHQNQEWQGVVDVFEQIHAEAPAYPDPEQLFNSTREALEAQEKERRVIALYDEGQRHMDAKEWQRALECFEKVERLEPDYRDTVELLGRCQRELTERQLIASNVDRIQCLRTLTGYSDPISSVAFSPDGKLLATGAGDEQKWVGVTGGVGLYRVEDWEHQRTLRPRGQVYGVYSVAFSPDGELLAAGERDDKMRLWRVEDGAWLYTPKLQGDSVRSVAFSPDGELLATGSDDTLIRLYRVEDWKHQRTLSFWDGVHSVAFSPDGELLAAGGQDKTACLWQVEDGGIMHMLVHTGMVRSVAFSPDGKLLATGAGSSVRLYGVEDGRHQRTLGPTDWVYSVAFSPDGELLAAGGRDNSIRLWRVEDGRVVRLLRGHTDSVKSVAFSPDGSLLASGRRTKRCGCGVRDRLIFLWGDRKHTPRVWSEVYRFAGSFRTRQLCGSFT